MTCLSSTVATRQKELRSYATTSLQREVFHLTFPFVLATAFRQQNEVFDNPTDRLVLRITNTPGIGSVCRTRSYAWAGMVWASCVKSTRFSCAAHSNTTASSWVRSPTSCTR